MKYCPTRITRKGRAPKLEASGINSKEDKRWAGWVKCEAKPNPFELKRLVTLALRNSLLVTMKNHICQFDNQIYKQKHGGAIGMGIAGDVAKLFMVWWDRELKRRLQNHGIEIQLYKRYVDDTNIVVKTVTDMDARPNDETIMMEIQTIANEIHPSISVTSDHPTNHTNKRMPVLDLELWIDMVETNGTLKHQILFTHYMKPMTSKYIVNKRSALSTTMKKSVLVSDLVRTMRNVLLQCPESERQKHVQNFIKRMEFSGYDQQERDATPNEELARECQRIVNQSELKIKVIEKAGKSLKESLVLSDPFKNKTCEDNDCKVCKHDPKPNCK
eukprot:gene1548-1711_t